MRIALATILLAALAGCGGGKRDTPTSGRGVIAVCEEVLPLVREEEARFEELYPTAVVDLRPLPAREAITELFNDSVKMIVTARALNEEERAAQKAVKLEVTEVPVAIDAIAVVVNTVNDVTALTLPQLDSIFAGALMDWALLGWRGAPGRISCVIPERNTASHEVFAGRVLRGKPYTASATVVGSSREVLETVSGNPGAIGIAGVNWVNEPPAGVRVLELSDPDAPDSLGIEGKYFRPHPAYVYKGFYPIVRNVYIYTTPDSYGIPSGFTSFITSAAGQRIVVNQGLVPATMPVRLVELRKESL